eukprot:INCI10670.1.p1 GENE.INCI10670.1~~INCI10670.1.p1  ORF type:complete len:346 (-),score=32.32 INCI10670.1:100-1137(-)
MIADTTAAVQPPPPRRLIRCHRSPVVHKLSVPETSAESPESPAALLKNSVSRAIRSMPKMRHSASEQRVTRQLPTRVGFVKAAAAMGAVLAVALVAHFGVFTQDDFHFWDMTPRHVARPQQWTSWEGKEEAAVTEFTLCCYRMLCASVVFWTVIICITGRDPLVLRVSHTTEVSILGVKRLSTFSMIAWSLEGVFFLCASLCHFRSIAPSWLAKVTWVLFEVCCSFSLLVFVVVRCVLIPYARRAQLTATVEKMNSWIPWTVHNVNVAMLVVEYALNTLSFQPSHCVFVMYFSAVYCVFSWLFFYFNGYFFYFFLDFRNQYGFLAYAGIPAVLSCVHFVLCMLRY